MVSYGVNGSRVRREGFEAKPHIAEKSYRLMNKEGMNEHTHDRGRCRCFLLFGNNDAEIKI